MNEHRSKFDRPTQRPSPCRANGRNHFLAGRCLAWLCAALLVCLATPAAAKNRARILIDERIVADTKKPVPFPIRFEAANGSPPNSFVRIHDLPTGVKLTEGYRVSTTTWAVPLDRLMKLHLVVPATTASEFILRIQLVSLDGAIHARKAVTLRIALQPLAPPKLVSAAQKRESKARRRAADVIAATSTLAVGTNSTADQPGAAATSMAAADAARARRFLTKGNGYLLDGNINTARLFYRRAADIGLAAAAVAMAATFDPKELAKLGIIGLPPDVAEARRWYERAKELGAEEADARLARLAKP